MRSKKPKMKLSALSKADQLRISKLKDDQLLEEFPRSKYGFTRAQLRDLRKQAQVKFLVKEVSPEIVDTDIKYAKVKNKSSVTEKKNRVLIEQVERLQAENEAILKLNTPAHTHIIKPLPTSNGNGEATAVLLASDWHVEERVTPASVNGQNEYSLDIARKRADEFFQTGLKFRNMETKNTRVPRLVLALLGDFITGNIHEENLAVCSLPPVEAAIEAKNLIKSGIDFLLKESDLQEIIIPCHAGNHSRITKKRRSSETEMGNALELFVYSFLQQEYANEPRVKFLISRSYTSRLQIYDVVLRLHHGHSIRYLGGIGGLSVPTQRYRLRANTAWNADYDVFGHHHQKHMGIHYICNGSMIGWNAYAQDGGFEYEPPSQTYFLINRRFKDIIDYRPILFSV